MFGDEQMNFSFTSDNLSKKCSSSRLLLNRNTTVERSYKKDVPNRMQSPRTIQKLRRSEVSPQIYSERPTLNERRFNHKIAKNSSVDNMGYVSQEYESIDNSMRHETLSFRVSLKIE